MVLGLTCINSNHVFTSSKYVISPHSGSYEKNERTHTCTLVTGLSLLPRIESLGGMRLGFSVTMFGMHVVSLHSNLLHCMNCSVCVFVPDLFVSRVRHSLGDGKVLAIGVCKCFVCMLSSVGVVFHSVVKLLFYPPKRLINIIS